jgi:hypothetical protein
VVAVVTVAAGAGVVAGTMVLFPFAFLLFGVVGGLEALVDVAAVVVAGVVEEVASPVVEVPVAAVLLWCFR